MFWASSGIAPEYALALPCERDRVPLYRETDGLCVHTCMHVDFKGLSPLSVGQVNMQVRFDGFYNNTVHAFPALFSGLPNENFLPFWDCKCDSIVVIPPKIYIVTRAVSIGHYITHLNLIHVT